MSDIDWEFAGIVAGIVADDEPVTSRWVPAELTNADDYRFHGYTDECGITVGDNDTIILMLKDPDVSVTMTRAAFYELSGFVARDPDVKSEGS